MTDSEAKVILESEYKFHGECSIFGEALIIAIKELEKQMPKKVKIQQWIYTKCDCGYEFSKHHGDGYYSIPLEKKTNYCPKCGQKLDWSDTD